VAFVAEKWSEHGADVAVVPGDQYAHVGASVKVRPG
jgi:hypothetical protein